MEHSTNIKQLQNEIKSLKEQLRKYEHYNITDETVDDILDEIDAKEKQETKSNNALNWYEIKDKLRIQDIEYIKNLIVTNVLTVNEKDPMYGRTLLMYASMFGSYDIAELLCQIHADIDLTDNGNQSALDHALHFTNYHIVQLLQFTKLGASLGTYVKDKIETLNKQNGITRYSIKKLSKTNLKQLVKLLMEAIKDRAPFSDDMMHIAWQYLSTQKNAKPLQSPLFKLILETFEDIISNTRNKVDWCWLQEFLIPSTIWLLKKHPNDDTDETLLFDELLTRVHKETQKQYKIHLLKDINRIKEKNEGLWNELKAFEIDIPPNQSRQDQIPNGVKARYSKKELLHLKPLRSSFNPYTHYDLNQYLNELLLRAHIIDDDFQKDVQLMVNEIQSVNYEVSYRRGPVKLKSRCVSKIENDYHKEAFPTSAHLLDINRCSLTFDSLSSIMNGMKQLIDKINDGHTCLKSIIRYKNGFSANGQFDDQHPKYADVKLNVRIQSKADPHKEVIGEIQILLRSMMEFKRMKAHPLYSIERREEFVHNFKQIAPSMLNKQKQLFTLELNEEYANRIIFLTDAQPNAHSGKDSLLDMVKRNSSTDQYKGHQIHTTFIGVGLDFNTAFIEDIIKVPGGNYYAVHSNAEFIKTMDEEFKFMVTPIVFGFVLTLMAEGNACCIEEAFGSGDDEKAVLENGEVMNVQSMFPSQHDENDEVKGGVVVLKLKNDVDGKKDATYNMQIRSTYKDVDGKAYKLENNVMFASTAQKDEEYYDNLGIRKSLLLVRYVQLLKLWMQYQNKQKEKTKVTQEYKEIIKQFILYFEAEMKIIKDHTLQKELKILNQLIKK
eukprot:64553_1